MICKYLNASWRSIGHRGVVLSLCAAAAVLATACGGGGGGGGAVTPYIGAGVVTDTSPKLAAALLSSTGAVVSGNQISGADNYTYRVVLLDYKNTPISNTLVAFTVDSGLQMTPASGQAVTDASGVASITVKQADAFAGGAGKITASASVDTPAVNQTPAGTRQVEVSTNVSFSASSALIAAPVVSASTVPAYGSIKVTTSAKLASDGRALSGFPITFAASCGVITSASVATDDAGVASTVYENKVGTGTCTGDVRITASGGGQQAVTTVQALAPTVANIAFTGASPSRIYLKNGASQATMTFKVLDTNGVAVSGKQIKVDFVRRPTGSFLNGVPGTASVLVTTDSDGVVKVVVNAGIEPGPVQLSASLADNDAVKVQSTDLAIGSGLPAQARTTVVINSPNGYNIEGAQYVENVSFSAFLADRLGNPVPDGTTVNFVAEGGVIAVACKTAGAETGVSRCTVDMATSNPQPADGRVTILAWAAGEEDFVNGAAPTNNLYDEGESFTDLGQPFLDKNFDGIFTPGQDETVGTGYPSGAFNCGRADSVAGTCDGKWGENLVRATFEVTFSGSAAVVDLGTPTVANGQCRVPFRLKDALGNPMPFNTALAIDGVKGGNADPAVMASAGTIEGAGAKVPNTVARGGTNHVAVFNDCTTSTGLSFSIGVTTPRGNFTSFSYKL